MATIALPQARHDSRHARRNSLVAFAKDTRVGEWHALNPTRPERSAACSCAPARRADTGPRGAESVASQVRARAVVDLNAATTRRTAHELPAPIPPSAAGGAERAR